MVCDIISHVWICTVGSIEPLLLVMLEVRLAIWRLVCGQSRWYPRLILEASKHGKIFEESVP